MIRHRFFAVAGFATALLSVSLFAGRALADAWDPPATYYNWASGTGATLKAQLNEIIDSTNDPGFTDELHTPVSYDTARSALQITDDATPNNTSDRVILLVYDRVALDVSNINPGGEIPGWNGTAWDREHTWPQSRGLGGTGMPDGSDLHALRPSTPSVNNNRGNRNFMGAFGAQSFGIVDLPGVPSQDDPYYPGNADAGMIARHSFYMAVRYDGSDANTEDLELGSDNIVNVSGDEDPPPQMGDVDRLVEWHFAAPPDDFERRRNQVIYANYQHNRNPFIDRPEFMWSVFVDQANDSRITINGAPESNGATTQNVDFGRIFAGSTATQGFTLNKTGTDGTYFEIAASGQATSTISGRYNAFHTNQTDSKPITVGVTTSSAGLRTGSVTVNNLDITTGGGAGRGANDGNDVFNVSATVLDHATPSFDSDSTAITLTHNFGNIPIDSLASFNFDVFNREATPGYTALMNFDSVSALGDTTRLTTNASPLVGSLILAGGAGQTFTSMLNTAATGTFSALYTLNFSDENIAGAQNKSITLNLSGTVRLPGDYDGNGIVDLLDFLVWRTSFGAGTAKYGGADGDGSNAVDHGDYDVWQQNFGASAPAGGSGGSTIAATVPEPATISLVLLIVACHCLGRRRSR